jgi:hypothetical protein
MLRLRGLAPGTHQSAKCNANSKPARILVRGYLDHKDFIWCPRHKDTPRQFECTRLITVNHVKAAIQPVPGFAQCFAQSTTASPVTTLPT